MPFESHQLDPMVKLCKDCRFFCPDEFGGIVPGLTAKCLRQRKVDGPSLINGKISREDFYYCSTQRSCYPNTCGVSQSLLVFPKFGLHGCGFAKEEDWNTNLPIAETTEALWNHIKHNRAGAKEEVCLAALRLLRAAAKEYGLFTEEQEERLCPPRPN